MKKFVLFALWMMVKGAVAERGEFGARGLAEPALLERQATSSSATTTSSAASSTSTPFLVFVGISSLTTCTSGSVRWVYSGPDTPLSLMITNINVTQTGSSSVTASSSSTTALSSTASRSPITDLTARAIPTYLTVSAGDDTNTSDDGFVKIITTSADPSNDLFTWDKVDVPQGWYKIWASMEAYPDFSQATSSDYFVTNGSDISCLLSSGGSSSSSTFMSSTMSSTSSPSATAIVGAVSSVNKGAIAGGVVGGVALLSAVLAALVYFLCASQRRRRTATLDPSNGGTVGRWGTLGSFDSTHSSKSQHAKATKQKAKKYNGAGVVGMGGYDAEANGRVERHHSQADSLGPIVSYGHAITESPVSEETFNPYASYEDKYSSRFPASLSEENGEELVMTHTVGYSPRLPHAGRQSTSSIESYVLNNNFSRPRSQTQTQRMPPSPQQAYPESPSTSSVLTPDSRRFSSPVLPMDDGVFVGYQQQQQQQSPRQTPRRMPRKPVPSYNPTDLPEPLPAHLHSSMTSLPHTPSPAHSVHSLVLTEDVHQLIHKGSFSDGRPVHVLMPDLPPPQRI
ncbi:uncharacterized protein EV420DRAFT_1565096 [Desarmillaria tabescens]|uniref:Uncharacterized protein n=1 Tax=Armillaria tabescens TaxID=1929756 RepID=A0AA39JVL7_ARMTA|nr:uncharacterized protein EV420DRAFT_1565096 [Desarmillaria tabescens]KAK0449624.1 hypothetical protein EV420DRAFT_1565096 [Desarmillaria tabescens]